VPKDLLRGLTDIARHDPFTQIRFSVSILETPSQRPVGHGSVKQNVIFRRILFVDEILAGAKYKLRIIRHIFQI
jgi:hypothetical protein